MRTPIRCIRLNDQRWRTFIDHLGMDWLRKQIDKAEKKASAPKKSAKPVTEE